MFQKRFSILSILLLKSLLVSANQPPTLFEQASGFIMHEPNLHTDLAKYAPTKVQERVGFHYCKENMVQSWKIFPKITTLRDAFGDKVRGVHFLAETDIAVSIGSKGTLRWWDTTELTLINEEVTGQTNVTGLAVTNQGTLIATVAGTTCKIWDAQTGMLMLMIEHDEPVHCVAFSGESYLVVGGALGKVWVWDISSGCSSAAQVVHGRDTQYPVFAIIKAVSLSKDGKVLTTLQDTSVKKWNIATQACIKEVTLPCTATPGKAAFLGDTQLLSCFTDGTLIFTDCDTLESRKHTLSMKSIETVVPSPDGKFLLIGTELDTVQLWERSGKDYSLIREFTGGRGYIGHIAFQSDGLGFLAGDCFGTLQYWSMSPMMRSMTLSEAQNTLERGVFSDIYDPNTNQEEV